MNFSQYVEEVKMNYLKNFSIDLLESAEKYFLAKESQELIKERFNCYTSDNKMIQGTGKPEAVVYCLSLMYE